MGLIFIALKIPYQNRGRPFDDKTSFCVYKEKINCKFPIVHVIWSFVHSTEVNGHESTALLTAAQINSANTRKWFRQSKNDRKIGFTEEMFSLGKFSFCHFDSTQTQHNKTVYAIVLRCDAINSRKMMRENWAGIWLQFFGEIFRRPFNYWFYLPD